MGFSSDERYLLILSWNGRGLVDTESGDRVARDYEDPSTSPPWLDQPPGTVQGIGPLSGVVIRCVGIWGGKLPKRKGGWRVDVRVGETELFLTDERTEKSWKLPKVATEIRAYGFSGSGRILIVATSSEVELFRRAT